MFYENFKNDTLLLQVGELTDSFMKLPVYSFSNGKTVEGLSYKILCLDFNLLESANKAKIEKDEAGYFKALNAIQTALLDYFKNKDNVNIGFCLKIINLPNQYIEDRNEMFEAMYSLLVKRSYESLEKEFTYPESKGNIGVNLFSESGKVDFYYSDMGKRLRSPLELMRLKSQGKVPRVGKEPFIVKNTCDLDSLKKDPKNANFLPKLKDEESFLKFDEWKHSIAEILTKALVLTISNLSDNSIFGSEAIEFIECVKPWIKDWASSMATQIEDIAQSRGRMVSNGPTNFANLKRYLSKKAAYTNSLLTSEERKFLNGQMSDQVSLEWARNYRTTIMSSKGHLDRGLLTLLPAPKFFKNGTEIVSAESNLVAYDYSEQYYVPLPIEANSLVVQLGQQFSIVTKGKLLANGHGVVPPKELDALRLQAPTFYSFIGAIPITFNEKEKDFRIEVPQNCAGFSTDNLEWFRSLPDEQRTIGQTFYYNSNGEKKDQVINIAAPNQAAALGSTKT